MMMMMMMLDDYLHQNYYDMVRTRIKFTDVYIYSIYIIYIYICVGDYYAKRTKTNIIIIVIIIVIITIVYKKANTTYNNALTVIQ